MTTVDSGDAAGVAVAHVSETPEAQPRSRSRLADLLCLLVLSVTVVILVALHLNAYPQLSPGDEQSHADYVLRAPGLLPVVSGDRWSPEVLRAEACRGIDSGFDPPSCEAPVLRPEEFELEGYNSAYIHPPTYYNVTAVVARLLVLTRVTVDEFAAARAVGALWLIAGLLVAWWAARRLGCRRLPLMGALLLVIGVPGVILMSATITPDASNILVGAVVSAAVIVADQRLDRRAVVALVVAGVVAAGFKLQNVLILFPLVLFLVHRAVERAAVSPRGQRLRALLFDRGAAAAVVLVATAGVVAVGWSAVWQSSAVVPPDQLPIAGLLGGDPLALAYLTFGEFLPPRAFYVPAPLFRPSVNAWSQMTIWIIVGCLFAAAATIRAVSGRLEPSPPVVALARGCLVAGALGGPLLVLLSTVTLGTAFPLPPRYGATLLVPMVLVVAYLAKDRWLGYVVLGTGCIAVVLQGLGLARV